MAKAPVPTPVNGDSKPADGAETGATAATVTAIAEPGAVADAEQDAEHKPEQPIEAEAAADVEVRVLHDHLDHRANDVATLSAHDAEVAVKAGWADADPDAVAYAKSQVPAPAAEDA